MNHTARTSLLAGLFLAGTAAISVNAQHINAGALGTSQGDQLYFANGAAFVAGSGFVKPLTYSSTGAYAGYINGSITFTALSRLGVLDTASPNAAALGSFLEIGIDRKSVV